MHFPLQKLIPFSLPAMASCNLPHVEEIKSPLPCSPLPLEVAAPCAPLRLLTGVGKSLQLFPCPETSPERIHLPLDTDSPQPGLPENEVQY